MLEVNLLTMPAPIRKSKCQKRKKETTELAQNAAPSEDQVINHNQEANVTANVTSQWVVSVKVSRLPERKRIMSIKGVKQIWGFWVTGPFAAFQRVILMSIF